MRFPDPTATTIVHEARDERQFKHSWNASISAKDFVQLEYRAIDTRPCAVFTPEDSDWGEQDDISNVPRHPAAPWIRVLRMWPGTSTPMSEGDR